MSATEVSAPARGERSRLSRFGGLDRSVPDHGAASRPAWRRDRVPLAVALLFVVGYGLVAELAAQTSTGLGLSPWYPPVGLSLALVVACGWRAIPLIFVADALQLIVRGAGGDALDALAQGLAQAVFWGGTGLLLRPRLTVEPALSRLRDVLWFALAVIVGSGVAALGGVALITVLQDYPWADYWEAARVYFVGDAIGVLSVTPALLILAGLPQRAPQAAAAVREAVALGPEFWAMLAATLLVPALAIQGPGEFLPLAPLPMAWVALRLGMPAASVGLLLWSIAAVVAFAVGDNDIGLREISTSMVSGGLLAVFAGAVVTERERGRARLAYLALHDEVTGLPNRRGLEHSIAEAVARSERPAGVLYVRLAGLRGRGTDGLPEAVLVCAADRLRRLTGPESTIARIGSRRFVVLVDGPEAHQLGAVAQRLVDGLATPLEVDGFEYLLGPVVGSADVVAAPTEALEQAAQAAGVAEIDGESAVTYEHVAATVEREANLALDLRAAIETDQLSLAYQPIASIATGAVAGAEALLRWTHPQRGAVGPADFIPVAEGCGLILPLGRWVLQQACESAATWPCERDPLVVHVNVSPVQLRDEGFVGDVRDTLRATGLAPTRLCLELTESGVFDDLDIAARRILQLRELDVRVVLDDFGTGHSSLQWLQRLPVEALKIDRSFVSGVDRQPVDLAIVQATLGLAALLGLETVAEGVETAEQLGVLREQGCTSIQGYLLQRPIPESEFLRWLASYVPVADQRDETMF